VAARTRRRRPLSAPVTLEGPPADPEEKGREGSGRSGALIWWALALALGLLLGARIRRSSAASAATTLTWLPLMVLAGLWFPREVMPDGNEQVDLPDRLLAFGFGEPGGGVRMRGLLTRNILLTLGCSLEGFHTLRDEDAARQHQPGLRPAPSYQLERLE
jgi:hypothetical protein